MATEPKLQREGADDLTKSSKNNDVELKEDELGRVTAGTGGGGGAGLKIDHKE